MEKLDSPEAVHPLLAQLVKFGRFLWNLDPSVPTDLLRLAKEIPNEVVFSEVQYRDNTSKYFPLGEGTSGEVALGRESLDKIIIGGRPEKIILYHTHPGNIEQHLDAAPPSSDDFQMIINTLNWKLDIPLEHRIITPSGIWSIGLTPQSDIKEKADEVRKLGSLFLSLDGITDPIDRKLKILALNKIKSGYGEIAASYEILLSNDGITQVAIDRFCHAMQKIGYQISFIGANI